MGPGHAALPLAAAGRRHPQTTAATVTHERCPSDTFKTFSLRSRLGCSHLVILWEKLFVICNDYFSNPRLSFCSFTPRKGKCKNLNLIS